jgi:hypothetical protein
LPGQTEDRSGWRRAFWFYFPNELLQAREAGRFSVNALLSTSSLVRHNDTIFRDGFGGTGL